MVQASQTSKRQTTVSFTVVSLYIKSWMDIMFSKFKNILNSQASLFWCTKHPLMSLKLDLYIFSTSDPCFISPDYKRLSNVQCTCVIKQTSWPLKSVLVLNECHNIITFCNYNKLNITSLSGIIPIDNTCKCTGWKIRKTVCWERSLHVK